MSLEDIGDLLHAMNPTAFREGIRLQAGQRFAAGEKTAVIAKACG
ncbi:hypothetical protein [Streptomyces sp. NPDC057686]